ncbi:MAG: M1 family metallopeptidase, partial [Terriglobales bacterium]
MKRLILFAILLPSLSFAQRLPKDVVPSHYTIRFQVDIAAGTFAGEETIRLRLAKASPRITLNAVGLDISDAYVMAGGKKLAARVLLQPEPEMVVFEFASSVPAGEAELHLRFKAPLRDDLRGLYRTKSERRQYAATQFEATYARMAFPGFDEPEFKATFDISVVTDAADTAISNGALLRTTPGPGAGKHTLTFATSPKISTYLVAIAVGDFGCVEGAADGTPIRVCAVPEKKELGRFALKAAENFLGYFNRYYGIRYPFKKLDMVAIPNYEWGGMENTAAIFYKERGLLIDEKTASVAAKRGTASLVAHEMAHQWFGDLVTMQWWDNIWLNEGFATWMTFKPLAEWDPSWDQSVSRAVSASFVITEDSLASSRPIRANASTPEEIKELFDGVAYAKGGAVLRMVEAYVGEESFRKGVNRYLQKHANGNATAEDLWMQLTAASRKPVDKIMRTFIDQPGVPLLSVEYTCGGGKTSLKLSQERFGSAGRGDQLWNIPVCTRALGTGAANCSLMTQPRHEVVFAGCDERIVNAGASGYYRTAYAPELFPKISAAAAEGRLTPAETIVLLSDQWALVQAGRAVIGDYLELSGKLRHREETAVIQQLISRAAGVRVTFTDEHLRPRFDAWLMSVLRPTMERVGLEPKTNDTDEIRNLRGRIFALLGEMGDAAAVARARTIVGHALADPGSVDAGMANIAFSIAAKNGDAALYGRIMAAMNGAKAQSPEQYSRLLFTLAEFDDPALVQRSLEFVRSPQ